MKVVASYDAEQDTLTFRKGRHPINLILVLIVLAFFAWELVSVLWNEPGQDSMLTLSEYVWAFIGWGGFFAWLAVGCFCGWLAFHFLLEPRIRREV